MAKHLHLNSLKLRFWSKEDCAQTAFSADDECMSLVPAIIKIKGLQSIDVHFGLGTQFSKKESRSTSRNTESEAEKALRECMEAKMRPSLPPHGKGMFHVQCCSLPFAPLIPSTSFISSATFSFRSLTSRTAASVSTLGLDDSTALAHPSASKS